jgi:hypothetical protein
MRRWWTRRRARRDARQLDGDLLPADLVALFVVSTWIREWGEGLMKVSAQFHDDGQHDTGHTLYAMGHTLRHAADVVASGDLEPGGEHYQRLMAERFTEP